MNNPNIIWSTTLNGGVDANGNIVPMKVDADGSTSTEQTNAYNTLNDTMKVETAGQAYYDLLPTDMVFALNTAQTIGGGSNYVLSATGGWIIHPDIKRAKAIQFWGKLSQSTEVKLYMAPTDTPDSNTQEFVYRGNGETEYMFQDKTGGAFTPNYPAASRILPISCNSLKIYMKTTTGGANTISDMRLRLIF